VVVAAATAVVSSDAAIASNAAENYILNAAFNVVCNVVSLCFPIYFDVALNYVFNAVSLLFHADVNLVPKAFHLYIHMCFSD